MPRPCKYGERDASGKCPPKPKASNTKKVRPCKYGARDASGKCPPKPKASIPRTRKTRNVVTEDDYEKEVSDMIEESKNQRIFEEERAAERRKEAEREAAKIDVEIVLYEKNKKLVTNEIFFRNLDVIKHHIMQQLGRPVKDNGKILIVKGVVYDKNSKTIEGSPFGGINTKYPVGKKLVDDELRDELNDSAEVKWGKVHVMYKKI